MSIFSLKIIALITMLIDHIGEFFPKLPHVIILRQIGRISAPIFMFALAQGIKHTSSPKNYTKRLYFLSLVMGIGNSILTFLLPDFSVELTNNFPATLFLTACICFIYNIKEQGGDYLPIIKKFTILQFAALPISLLVERHFPVWAEYAIRGIYPNIFTCEGGIFFICMGFILYCFCDDPKKLSISYLFLCSLYAATEIISIYLSNLPMTRLFTDDVQWMMIFALVFMLNYNGKKGYTNKYCKYLFYIFYPAHIWLLYIISYKIIHIK